MTTTPSDTGRETPHDWTDADDLIKWPHCGRCGVIRRRDGATDDRPCPGPAPIGLRAEGRKATALDPFDPTVIAPGLAAIPLTPTPWDDLPDGQHAVTPDGTVWQRRKGLWHRDPWWQGSDDAEIIAICNDPDEYAFDLGWTRKHVEDHHGWLRPITLPKEDSDG